MTEHKTHTSRGLALENLLHRCGRLVKRKANVEVAMKAGRHFHGLGQRRTGSNRAGAGGDAVGRNQKDVQTD